MSAGGSPKSISAPWSNRPPLFAWFSRGLHVPRKVNVSASFLADVSCHRRQRTQRCHHPPSRYALDHLGPSQRLKRTESSSFVLSSLCLLPLFHRLHCLPRFRFGGSSQKSQQQIHPVATIVTMWGRVVLLLFLLVGVLAADYYSVLGRESKLLNRLS